MYRVKYSFGIIIVLAIVILTVLKSCPIKIYAQEVQEISENSISNEQAAEEETLIEISENTAGSAAEPDNGTGEENSEELPETASDNTISGNETEETSSPVEEQMNEDEEPEAVEEAVEEISENEISENEISENEIKTGEVELPRPDVVSVELPLVEENEDIFNFILDPDQLINATGAVKYGGKSFQDGATVFFKNKRADGETEYSDTSDQLEIVNRSTVSVNLVVNVTLTGIENINVKDSPEFDDKDSPSVWFELIDNEGNTVPLNQEGIAYLSYVIDAAPEEAYRYNYNEETGEYELESNFEEIEFPKYEFAVKAACGGTGWARAKEMPKLTVRWEVNPIIEDEETVESDAIEEE